jgi:hypothetical protein
MRLRLNGMQPMIHLFTARLVPFNRVTLLGSGLLQVRTSSFSPIFQCRCLLTRPLEHFISALTGLGIRIPKDAASGNAVGLYFNPHNQDPLTVSRSDARRGYWEAASHRPRLSLLAGRTVSRLITKQTPQGPTVTGVEVCI